MPLGDAISELWRCNLAITQQSEHMHADGRSDLRFGYIRYVTFVTSLHPLHPLRYIRYIRYIRGQRRKSRSDPFFHLRWVLTDRGRTGDRGRWRKSRSEPFFHLPAADSGVKILKLTD